VTVARPTPPLLRHLLAVLAVVPGAVLGALCFARPSIGLWLFDAAVAAAVWGAIVVVHARTTTPVPPLLFAIAYMPTLAAAFAWLELVFDTQ
jgi:hypothetical protein